MEPMTPVSVSPDEMAYGDGTLTPEDHVSPGARKLASEIAQAITEDGYGITIVGGVPILNNEAELLIAQMIDPLFDDCKRLQREAEAAEQERGAGHVDYFPPMPDEDF